MAAATPAICRPSRGRAGRVSHISRSVLCTSEPFMAPGWPGPPPPTSGDALRNRRGDPDGTPPGPCDDESVTSPVPTSPAPVAVPPPAGALHRRRSGRLVAGVAGGVADHLGVKVLWVRAAFVALMAVSGAGVLAYGLLWIFVRQESATVERTVSGRERQQALGLAALGLGVGLAASALGNSAVGPGVGPPGVAVAGAAVVWRGAGGGPRPPAG